MVIRNFIVSFCLILSVNFSFSQTFDGSAEKESSILFFGGNLGFNVQKIGVKFDYVKKESFGSKEEWQYFIFGEINGQAKEGIVSIFSNGLFSPDARTSARFGFSKSFGNNVIDGIDGNSPMRQQILNEVKENKWNNVFSFFISGEIFGTYSQLFNGIDTTNIGNSFADEFFRGYKIGLGSNMKIGANFIIGSQLKYGYVNNFNEYEAVKYNLSTTNTVGNQSLVNVEEKAAYNSETYQKYHQIELRQDILGFIRLNKNKNSSDNGDGRISTIADHHHNHSHAEKEEKKEYLAVNVYSNQLIPNNRISLINGTDYKTNLSFGVAGYFFTSKSKFSGGVFVEVQDVLNSIYDASITDDSNDPIPELKSRIFFGLTTKFSFGNIVETLFNEED